MITVPAYFNDAQRTATRDAGRLAGLEVLRIINEPTAASLAYGLDKRNRGTIAVYDLGGGTFDISILKVEDGVFEVLATNGDTHLGGDDIDRLLTEQVLVGDCPVRAALPAEALQAIRKGVIQAKWDLSELEETVIRMSAGSRSARRHSRGPSLASEFESLIAPIVERTLGPVRQALADAGLQPADIDEVVLVGGSTRVPLVRRRVEELFGRRPHSELNPDEVVALGAAVQADILVSGHRDMLLLDVTPLSLGIETMGGVVSKIIMRNSTVPASGRDAFTTGVDNQTAVEIHVLQGEREMAADCRSLARFRLRGIPPMPAGLPRIEVTFQIDANGILSVGRPRAAHRHRAEHRSQAVVRADRRGSRAHADRIVRACGGRLRGTAPDRRAQRSRGGRHCHGEVAASPGLRRAGGRPTSTPRRASRDSRPRLPRRARRWPAPTAIAFTRRRTSSTTRRDISPS